MVDRPSDNQVEITRGNNELYDHRLTTEQCKALTADLTDQHDLVTLSINGSVHERSLKVCIFIQLPIMWAV